MGTHILSLHAWKNANLHFLRTASVTSVSANATVMAFLVLNGPLIRMASTFWGSLFEGVKSEPFVC